jgi:hypothetical protein
MSEGNETSFIFEEMEDAYHEAANVEKGVYNYNSFQFLDLPSYFDTGCI